ncbi:hypothetical protein Poli38472_011554 [Pythium oligandrum]|uniref:EF-hand domain-containing protein n=1 Tax=Pythium oligandrum TaxID=41045 RepID=A0A8K1CJE2_PYTOL|nr:hypothetical protein Poli38472_011554 [Pythium oligandrum]|eukprot:TMW64674.1 hypothetical protein Poli38472_011554 [Pythium oligandrum]
MRPAGRRVALAQRLSRTGSVVVKLGASYLEGLMEFFQLCDADEDGKLIPNELDLLLAMLGVLATKSSWNLQRSPSKVFSCTTFDQFLVQYGRRLHSEAAPLPPVHFLRSCKQLKSGFKRCDTDGDHVITTTELEIALQKLDVVVTDEILQHQLALLDSNNDGTIEWSEFLRAAWRNASSHAAKSKSTVLLLDTLRSVPAPAIVHRRPSTPQGRGSGRALADSHGRPPGKKQLNKSSNASRLLYKLALRAHLIWQQQPDEVLRPAEPAQDTAARRHRTLPVKSRVEHIGVRILTRISMQQVSNMKRVKQDHTNAAQRRGARATLPARGPHSMALPSRKETRTRLSPDVRRRVFAIEFIAVILSALAGIVSGLVSIKIESVVPIMRQFDILSGTSSYYLVVLGVNIAISLVEVNLMYLTSVICAFRMTVATRLTLYPQDAEREFLTRAIARAALQVSHRTEKLFGLDPMKDSPRLVFFLSFLMFRSKRSVIKLLLKLFIRRVFWRAAAKATLSLMVLPLNAILNAWTLRRVMRNCRVTIIGPPCVTALMEEFFSRHNDQLRPFQRVDYLRVLGCAIVCKRSIHPNLEIMVHQLRNKWVTTKQWALADGCVCISQPDDPCPVHQLDDTDRFFASLLLYSSQRHLPITPDLPVVQHEQSMLCLLILAFVLDGNLTLTERRLYLRACQVARIESDWPGVFRIMRDFLNGKGIRLEAVYAMLKPVPRWQIPKDELSVKSSKWEKMSLTEFGLYVADRLSSLIAI